MAATTDRSAHAAQQKEDKPCDQQNGADDPQDVYCRDGTDYQQDDSQNDQCASSLRLTLRRVY